MFGGWKILFHHCPDCAVEHMKKTQEKLVSMQEHKEKQQQQQERKRNQSKKSKKRNSRGNKEKSRQPQDSVSGTNLGDEDCASAENDKKASKKKSHRVRKKEKGQSKEDLAETTAVLPPPPLKNTSSRKDEEVAIEEEAISHLMVQGGGDHHENSQHLNENETKYEVSTTLQQTDQHQQTEQPNELSRDADQYLPCGRLSPPKPDQSQDESFTLAPRKTRISKRKPVNGLPWSDYNGHSGRYTGEVNEQYLPHGRGEMVYDRGEITKGIWYDGVLDTEDAGFSGGTGSRQHNNAGPAEGKYTPETLPNHSCGDKGRPEDMIITSKKETAAAVALLRKNDAAWVRRSDGSWTYAIVKVKNRDFSLYLLTLCWAVKLSNDFRLLCVKGPYL